jgi:hypothetical protein
MAVLGTDSPKHSFTPTLHLQLSPWPTMAVTVTGPQAEVGGFSMTSSEPLTQAGTDSLTGKLRDFYDSLTHEEQRVLAAVIGQAAEYGQQASPPR